MRSLQITLSLLVLSLAAFAQGDRGTLTGTVADPAGAIVPGASVQATNTLTGAAYDTVTTQTGNYVLAQMPTGVYDLTFSSTGFTKFVQKGVTVGVAQTSRIDVTLQVGSTSESVTVTSDAPLLKTESAEQSYNISTERMNNLPLNFGARGPGSLRNPFTFIQLLPGANITARNNIRVNGQPNVTYGIRLEGQNTDRPLDPNNADMVAPSVEAVQEIAVQTSNFSAEYGQVIGGLFNFTTKSGSNQYHGSAYSYFVNEFLHSGIPFTDNGKGGHIRPGDRKQDYGASIGGPVEIPKLIHGRDKTFFFFNIEKYVNRAHAGGAYTTVPTTEYRNGDFSAARAAVNNRVLATDPLGRSIIENTVYDPNTTRTENNARVRDPFPNNTIPVARFDPISAKIQNFFPTPTRAGLVNNWEQVYTTVRKNEITSIKIDHTINAKSKFSFYNHYYRAKFGNNGADGLGPPVSAKRLGLARTHTIRANYDYSVDPTTLVHVGVGVMREYVPDVGIPGVIDYDTAKELGLTGAVGLGFPRITGLSGSQGGMALSIGPTNANYYFSEKPTATVSATMIRSNHTYKVGAEWRIDAFTNRNLLNTYGSYSFGGQQTTLPSTQGQNLGGGAIGYSYASFLLGLASSGSVSNPQDPQYRKMAWGLFVQDTWKFTRKLSFDYGLRYDYQPQMHELWDRVSAFDPNRANPSAGGLLGATSYEGYGTGRCNCRFSKPYPYAFGPRIGIAYQYNAKTVVRLGWGVTYGASANFNYIGTTVGTGFNTFNVTSTTFGEPALVFRNGIKPDPAVLYASDLNPGIRPTAGQIDGPSSWIDPDGRPSRVHQWSAGVQREITKNLVVEASYVGNRGAWHQANSLIDINALTPERIRSFGLDISNAADRTLLTTAISNASVTARGFRAPYSGYPTGQTLAQILRPYPQFGNLGVRLAALGNNWYDSLQIKGTKRYSHGLDFTTAFTWQKELVRGADDQGGGGGPGINDVFNRRNQKSISGNSQPLVLVVGFNYQVPAYGANKFIRQAIGGWTVSGVLRYSSGLPIGVPGSNNQLNSLLFRGTRRNRVPNQPLFTKDLNCHCIDPYNDLVLNPNAWSDPAAGEWGYSAAYYNDYRSARRPDEQLSFGRTFRIKEGGMFLHFRAEFFNAFNRLQLAGPSSGNPQQATSRDAQGRLTGGYGYINALSSGTPRNGQVVARFQW